MTTPLPPVHLPRLSLFRCAHCGRTVPATPAEVRGRARGAWPQCCGAEMVLFIEAERPGQEASRVTALPLPLPGADPSADTTLLPVPPKRTPEE